MVDTDDLGHLWEHLVLGELHAQLGRDPVRYWRTKHGNEVDFVVVRRGRPPIAIECTWAASEFDPAGMKVFRAAYPNGPNFVVSADVSPARPYERATGPLRVRFVALADLAQEIASAGHRVRTPQTTPGVISDESDVDGLVAVLYALRQAYRHERLGSGGNMAMAVDEFQTRKTRERATPPAIEREGLASRPTTAATSS